MESHCLDACGNLTLPRPPHLVIRRRYFWNPFSPLPLLVPERDRVSTGLRVSCSLAGCRRMEPVRARKKQNVWSIDNDLAAAKATAEDKTRKYRRRKGRRVRSAGRRGPGARVLVSGSMLMEIETVLQTQEPVIKPAWDTFASSVSGIWKGVGAVFSPFTAEIEPIGIGKQNENLYDCYTRSLIEKVSEDGIFSHIRRKTNWAALNPFGESKKHHASDKTEAKDGFSEKETLDITDESSDLPSYDSFDLSKGEDLEDDVMGMEPGLVFFEDGSYSKGPVDLPVGGFDESKYFLSPTFKFEQCLVKGCHKRLRIVHTIEFNEGGSNIQIIRVAVYEEEWVSPANLDVADDVQFDMKPFSQRRRTQPSQLTGSWKVFEVSATPIFSDEPTAEGGLPFVYLCTETLKKRSLPESSVSFGEEEVLDMQDVTVLWLPGGVTGYVDVNKDGILTIGVGWYSDEGINLVMERDYGMDGKLKEVRSKSELKRRWTDS
ncbi:hypothetical protein MUK42_29635 [Musa troglodytarum]|uniref:Uncharacterized protein n=1 Tax=Musa troglodytarum TaxID=320322 RepID=A0A9E7FIP0_9LILI|nr:hypothetical protein MUK42_35653 [Musa troglodytarum]URD96609.1 hypothetical protein MUK42_29635 [Musa troglodytarum]